MFTDLTHNLDDNFTVGPSNCKTCADNVNTIIHMASRVGIPLAPVKLEGLTKSVVFLGYLIDSIRMQTALPDDKRKELLAELRSWSSRKQT